MIKLNDQLKRKIQDYSGFLVAQTTVKKQKNTPKEKQQKQQQKTKVLLNVTPITDHFLRNAKMGDTDPQSSIPCKTR